MSNYPFKKTEKHWQAVWEKKEYPFLPRPSKKKYVLEMLPYPSGKVHMGHVRNYTIGDAIARFYMLQGFDVLHPMGFDAFGLPAENAAIERGINPATWTYANIEEMTQDLKRLGFSYDWTRKFATCDLTYYKHEQRFFLEMMRKGLIYQKESYVNFDPVEQTVLANEQVVNGRGWRSGALVERKKLTQWFVKITAYADELLDDLKKIEWPEKVLKMQENWIGKSQGAMLHFSKDITAFTTRPDVLFGASFVALSPTHPVCLEKAKTDPKLAAFIEECNRTPTTEEALSTQEKKGYDLGFTVPHPFDPNWQLPVWCANFVLMEYGTGALYGCPAHDERDFEFATKYHLPIIKVLDEEQRIIGSKFLDGLTVEEGKKRAIEELVKQGTGEAVIQYRLRDWGVSRQRYWGCPIPIIYCDQCGVLEAPLPVELPHDIEITGKGNPLDHHPTWKHVDCPKCGSKARRETDTLDTFFESSWYFLRYCCPHSEDPLEHLKEWMGVDFYVGGIEHAVLHLLYARFFNKALCDLGYHDVREPFNKLITQGMVCHKTYQDENGKYITPKDLPEDMSKIKVGRSEKMSKSKYNVINPGEIIEAYGADAARLFVLSDTPIDKDFDWSDEGMEGCYRYINKLWRLFDNILQTEKFGSDQSLVKIQHRFVKNVTEDYNNQWFNKAIAHHREFVREIETCFPTQSKEVVMNALNVALHTIAPITPHIAAELWHHLSQNQEFGAWPSYDEDQLIDDEMLIIVQISGKKRGDFMISKSASTEEITKQALIEVERYIKDMPIKKTIYVPGKMVSVVL